MTKKPVCVIVSRVRARVIDLIACVCALFCVKREKCDTS